MPMILSIVLFTILFITLFWVFNFFFLSLLFSFFLFPSFASLFLYLFVCWVCFFCNILTIFCENYLSNQSLCPWSRKGIIFSNNTLRSCFYKKPSPSVAVSSSALRALSAIKFLLRVEQRVPCHVRPVPPNKHTLVIG